MAWMKTEHVYVRVNACEVVMTPEQAATVLFYARAAVTKPAQSVPAKPRASQDRHATQTRANALA